MILDRFSVEGKVAVVTGAGLGIGRGIAIGLAEAGADVVLAARTESDLEEVAGHPVPRPPGPGGAHRRHRRRRLRTAGHATVEEFGRLDILVNNAGGAMPRAAMDTSEGFMARTFAFNVTAPLTSPSWPPGRWSTPWAGAVVNISSRSASMTQTMFVAYGAAKAALDRMTRNIAPELAPRVRVNAIDVGGVATRSLDIVLTDDTLRRQFLDGTPMGRPGEPEDIACAVLYLVSDASSWVTGKVFEVDGGTEAPAMTVPPRLPSGRSDPRTRPPGASQTWRRRGIGRSS
jgi:7-alpha-hydroxysteroid dehydrogenase